MARVDFKTHEIEALYSDFLERIKLEDLEDALDYIKQLAPKTEDRFRDWNVLERTLVTPVDQIVKLIDGRDVRFSTIGPLQDLYLTFYGAKARKTGEQTITLGDPYRELHHEGKPQPEVELGWGDDEIASFWEKLSDTEGVAIQGSTHVGYIKWIPTSKKGELLFREKIDFYFNVLSPYNRKGWPRFTCSPIFLNIGLNNIGLLDSSPAIQEGSQRIFNLLLGP